MTGNGARLFHPAMERRFPLIAHVINGLRFGGNENLCLQLIKQAPPRFRHVLINIDPSSSEMRGVFETCEGLTLVDRQYNRYARVSFVIGLARDLKRLGVEGIIVYSFGVHIFVALAARISGVKNLVVHAGNPPPLDAKRRQLWKRILLASRALRVPIKSCSAMVDRELRALVGGLPAGSEAISNGVDVKKIEAAAAAGRSERTNGAPRVVGMVARFNIIKDHDTLLKAFALTRQRVDNLELWLIGDGERRLELVALAEELKIAEWVRFWGDRSDVHRLLGGMDVFTFSTSRDEGFGIALAEAMAARTPIVASDVYACREVLGQGDAGRLVPPKKERDLAAAIEELLTHPETARSLADRAFERVQQQLDIQRCAERFYASFGTAGP